jgi:hypothetical protein
MVRTLLDHRQQATNSPATAIAHTQPDTIGATSAVIIKSATIRKR